MVKKFTVTPAHGRVHRSLPNGQRVLVAIPGQEIPIEVAEELGLVEHPEPEPEPEPDTVPEVKDEEPPKPSAPVRKTASYPTKKSKA